jgi:hypothetical protein
MRGIDSRNTMPVRFPEVELASGGYINPEFSRRVEGYLTASVVYILSPQPTHRNLSSMRFYIALLALTATVLAAPQPDDGELNVSGSTPTAFPITTIPTSPPLYHIIKSSDS